MDYGNHLLIISESHISICLTVNSNWMSCCFHTHYRLIETNVPFSPPGFPAYLTYVLLINYNSRLTNFENYRVGIDFSGHLVPLSLFADKKTEASEREERHNDTQLLCREARTGTPIC